jgi:hypothetical protein
MAKISYEAKINSQSLGSFFIPEATPDVVESKDL